MKTLEECLATVSDPRRAQGRRYDLVHALLYCVLAVSAGGGNDHKYGKLGLDAATLEATAAQIQSQVSLGRFGTPQELVTTVLHLAVPESAFIVGTEAIVDGGMSQL
jgi:NAD(P)-dependent dehydrogenase (short-subunit alcohol dehydrogenase family)